jgi:AmiR/NasT family two-component response regulator
MQQLRNALTGRVHVEQAKGFLRESLDISVEQAFRLLRNYARTHGDHLTDVARKLMTDRQSRPQLLAAIAEFASATPP